MNPTNGNSAMLKAIMDESESDSIYARRATFDMIAGFGEDPTPMSFAEAKLVLAARKHPCMKLRSPFTILEDLGIRNYNRDIIVDANTINEDVMELAIDCWMDRLRANEHRST